MRLSTRPLKRAATGTSIIASCRYWVNPVWVREIGGGVFDEAGELEFLEGFVVDISDRKVVEDINAELLQELRLANEELSAQKQRNRARKTAERPLGQP